MAFQRTYKTLPLQKKLEVIDEFENKKLSAKDLAVKFKVGKTQIYQILQNRNKIRDKWLKGTSGDVKRLGRVPLNEKINNAVYEWVVSARAKGIPITGPIIQMEALEVAKTLGIDNFKASNGWLESFKLRHNIVFNRVGGEANLDKQTMMEWKKKLRLVVEKYETKNIFHGDETGIFFRGLPTNASAVLGDKCMRGNKSKERLTLFVCANMEGELQTPLVIGRPQYPRSFRNLNCSSLPVTWRFSDKAWMTGSIMEEWLRSFNMQMKDEDRNVILFIDNAPSHSKLELSNVKLEYFPQIRTIAQPLNLGVIHTLKLYYRKFVLQALVTKKDKCQNVCDLSKQINLLDAINWIHQAAKQIPSETVKKCFIKAGFPNKQIYTKDEQYSKNISAIAGLCREIGLSTDAANIINIINFDNNLATEFDNNLATEQEVWKASDAVQIENSAEGDDNEEEEEDGNESGIPQEPKISSYKNSLSHVNDLEEFAASQGDHVMMELLQEVKNHVLTNVVNKTRQHTVLQPWGLNKETMPPMNSKLHITEEPPEVKEMGEIEERLTGMEEKGLQEGEEEKEECLENHFPKDCVVKQENDKEEEFASPVAVFLFCKEEPKEEVKDFTYF